MKQGEGKRTKKEGEERKISPRSQTITIKMKNLRKILFRVWRPALLESMCLAPPPPYWLLCPPCSSIIFPLSFVFLVLSLPLTSLLWLLWPPWLSPSYFCSSVIFSSILVTLPCPPLLPATTCVIFLASVAFPMIPPFRFSLRFLCPFWLSQLSLELRKPQKVQRLISVWISIQTLDILHQFFTASLWI